MATKTVTAAMLAATIALAACSTPTPPAPARYAMTAATPPVIAPDPITHIPFIRTADGSLLVATSINGSVPLGFVLDSGAGTVVLPITLARQMFDQGVLTEAEFRGAGVSSLANGAEIRNLNFRLNSVSIGGITVPEVDCTVVDGAGPALLGASLLNRLRSWSVDNTRGTLDIGR